MAKTHLSPADKVRLRATVERKRRERKQKQKRKMSVKGALKLVAAAPGSRRAKEGAKKAPRVAKTLGVAAVKAAAKVGEKVASPFRAGPDPVEILKRYTKKVKRGPKVKAPDISAMTALKPKASRKKAKVYRKPSKTRKRGGGAR